MGQPPQGGPALRIGGAPPDARFYISTAPAMPLITLIAELIGPRSAGPVSFNWQFALAYSSYIITRPGQRAIAGAPKLIRRSCRLYPPIRKSSCRLPR